MRSSVAQVWRWGLVAVASVAALAGCHSSGGPAAGKHAPPRQPPPPLDVAPAVDPATGKPLTAEQALNSDPCAVQLHDISGAILMYYALNKQLPPRLEDVAPLADADAPLKFTCPASGRPYVYAPRGLASSGRSKRIIVYDATPAHDGKRWCILMDNVPPGSALALDVLAIPEATFKTYLPLGE